MSALAFIYIAYPNMDLDSKKDSFSIAVLFREGISFLWGIAKIYNVLGGVTSIILA